MNDYLRFQLFSLLDRIKMALQPWADEAPVAQGLRDIDGQMERLSTNRFRVAMVGEFKRGKSSLINTLLQRDVLPADVLPTTATFNRVVYGPEPRAYLKFKDGATQTVPIESLGSYITKLTEESEAIASRIDESVVEFPSMFCSNHVELIDTPGLNDSDALNEITLSRLQDIDLAIVTVSALYSFSDTEAGFVAKLLETSSVSAILFAVTMIDRIAEEEYDRVYANIKQLIQEKVLTALQADFGPDDPVMEKYAQLFSNPRIYFLSAKVARQALALQNEELYIKSGYRRFTADLPGILLEGQRRGRAEQPLWVAKNVLKRICDDTGEYARLQTRREALKSFKLRFASSAYRLADRPDAYGMEHARWEEKVSELMQRIEQRQEEITEAVTLAWNESDGTPQGRTLSILTCLPEVYLSANKAISAGMQQELPDALREISAQCFDEMRASSETLADMPALEKKTLQLWDAEKNAELFSAAAFQPVPFRWRVSPIDVAANQTDNAFYAYALNAFEQSMAAAVRENRAMALRVLQSFAAERKKRIEQMVRQAFELVSREEAALAENMTGTAKRRISAQEYQAFEQLQSECLVLEENWRRETLETKDASGPESRCNFAGLGMLQCVCQ